MAKTLDDVLKEHADYVKQQNQPADTLPSWQRAIATNPIGTEHIGELSPLEKVIQAHKDQFPDAYAAKKEPTAWYDQPIDKTGSIPMVDDYGRPIPGSEGLSTASMTPRQLALLATVPAAVAAGPLLGAAGVGAEALPYAVSAAGGLIGGTSGALAGEGTGGIATSALLGALAPGVGSITAPLANSRLLGAVSPAQWILKGAAHGARYMNMPHVGSAIDTIAHYFPSLPVAANVVAKTGDVLANPLAPGYVPAVNTAVGASP